MNPYDKIISMIDMIIDKNIKYSVPRLGQVLKVEDNESAGRILVSIPIFGWTTEDTGQWCYPKNIKSMITPKVGDWVIVEWINGKKNNEDFAIYSGIAYFMKDMLLENYDKTPKCQVLFEDNNKDIFIVYNEDTKKFNFKLKDFLFEIDSEGKVYSTNDGSNKINADANAGTYKIESGSGNVFDMASISIKLNENLEVLQ